MIELPEARTIANDLRKEILGKEIVEVQGNFTDHKFTFYYGDPNGYKEKLLHKKVTKIIDRNYYVEIEIENETLLLRDGANIRYHSSGEKLPEKSKLCIQFIDGSFITVTTSMYCFISVFEKGKEFQDDKYYNMELQGVGALDKEFAFEYFTSLLTQETSKLSVKAFIATEQRILGIGNGVAQDIMFHAHLHPKRKMNTLSKQDVVTLYEAIINTLKDMVCQGGRDVEKTIYSEPGGYRTILSNKTYQEGCRVCHGTLTKESYLGGTIYYCMHCQK